MSRARLSSLGRDGACSPSWKSRRDDLFIDQAAPESFFLFFSGAEESPRNIVMPRSAPLKNKKKIGGWAVRNYRQVIPTGFTKHVRGRARPG